MMHAPGIRRDLDSFHVVRFRGVELEIHLEHRHWTLPHVADGLVHEILAICKV